MVTPLVNMEHIHKWFGGNHVLNNVNFEVYPKEIMGLVGDNGAGKTTLVNMISGIVRPDRGKIKYNGEEVNIRSVSDARKLGIETIYQEQALVTSFSVTKNIFLGRELTKRKGLVKVLDDDRMTDEAKKVTRSLKLKISSMDQEIQFCSGGERQGVAIARAIYFKSKLIILDEPTTALSPKGVKRVMKFIRGVKKRGVSIVVISHNVYHIYDIADRIVCLSKGKVIGDVEKKKTSLDALNDMLLGIKRGVSAERK